MLMSSEAIFQLVDRLSRTEFGCFVAEFDAVRNETKHRICFRPTNALKCSDEYACKYLTFADDELETCVAQHSLTPPIESALRRELRLFVSSLTPDT